MIVSLMRILSPLAAVLCLDAAAWAAPMITNISPRGLQIGQPTTLVITGTDLPGDLRVMLAVNIASQSVKPGAKSDRVEIEVKLDEAAAPGLYALRVAGASRVAAIDDLADRPLACDLLVDPNDPDAAGKAFTAWLGALKMEPGTLSEVADHVDHIRKVAGVDHVGIGADFGSLTIVFSSDGGSTDEGFALYNFIRALPVPIHMHAVGHVGSMAVPVFLAGHERTCSPVSRFFFHAYDWEFEGTQMSDRIAEALKRLNSDIDLSREIAARHTKIPKERLTRLYATNPDPTIFTPQEAKRFAIVDDIVELNPEGESQDDVALWTVGW